MAGLVDDHILSLYGFGPMTPTTMAGRANSSLSAAPSPADRLQYLLDAGAMPAQALVAQPGVAARAVSDAEDDPSLANITNAGVQTALTFGRMIPAAGVAALGYGVAGARDAGGLIGGAMAQKRSQPEQFPNGFTRADLEPIAAQTGTPVEVLATMRRRQVQEIATQAASSKAQAQATAEQAAQEQKQREFNAAVERADSARDTILSDKPRKFSDTEVGKVYDKLGVVTPFFGALGANAVTRYATGGGSFKKDYGLPGALGALEGGVMANWPLMHEMIFQPPGNNERKAFEAYSRELPPDHPRKQEWQDYARGLKAENQDRVAASREFYDPIKFAERTGIGAVEGLVGGITGSKVVSATGRAGSSSWRPTARGQVGGSGAQGGHQGAGGGQQVAQPSYRTYNDLPQTTRDNAADAYLADRIMRGNAAPAQEVADAIRPHVNAPVTAKRVRSTNSIFNDFVAQNGRPPTKAEFDAIRNASTLGIAGITAAPLAFGIPDYNMSP